jgi:hypothetical protein
MSLYLNMVDTYPGVQKIRPKNKVLVRVLLIVPVNPCCDAIGMEKFTKIWS